MNKPNIRNLDGPLSSRVELQGIEIRCNQATFIVSPLNDRNRGWLLYLARVHQSGKPLDSAELILSLPELLANDVVRGWRDVSSGGTPVPYSRETAREMFELHPMLAQEIFEMARAEGDKEDARFAAEVREIKKPSVGASSGRRT